jgi:hypothetical protein
MVKQCLVILNPSRDIVVSIPSGFKSEPDLCTRILARSDRLKLSATYQNCSCLLEMVWPGWEREGRRRRRRNAGQRILTSCCGLEKNRKVKGTVAHAVYGIFMKVSIARHLIPFSQTFSNFKRCRSGSGSGSDFPFRCRSKSVFTSVGK